MPVNETMEMNAKRFFLRWKIFSARSVQMNLEGKENIFFIKSYSSDDLENEHCNVPGELAAMEIVAFYPHSIPLPMTIKMFNVIYLIRFTPSFSAASPLALHNESSYLPKWIIFTSQAFMIHSVSHFSCHLPICRPSKWD